MWLIIYLIFTWLIIFRQSVSALFMIKAGQLYIILEVLFCCSWCGQVRSWTQVFAGWWADPEAEGQRKCIDLVAGQTVCSFLLMGWLLLLILTLHIPDVKGVFGEADGGDREQPKGVVAPRSWSCPTDHVHVSHVKILQVLVIILVSALTFLKVLDHQLYF